MAARGELVSGAEVVVTPQEQPALIKRLYEIYLGSLPGAAKANPANLAEARAQAAEAKKPQASEQQMEQVLRANEQISDDDLLALGNRRAQSVKQWLATIGLVPEERLSLVAANIAAPATESAPEAATQASSGAAAPVAPPPAPAAPVAPPAAPAAAAQAPTAAAPAPSPSRVDFSLR